MKCTRGWRKVGWEEVRGGEGDGGWVEGVVGVAPGLKSSLTLARELPSASLSSFVTISTDSSVV